MRVRVRASTRARASAVEAAASEGRGEGAGGRDAGGGAHSRGERARRYHAWILTVVASRNVVKCSLKNASALTRSRSRKPFGRSPSKVPNVPSGEIANRVVGVNPAACTRGGGLRIQKGRSTNVRERRATGGGGAHPHRRIVDGRQWNAAAQRTKRRRSNRGHRPAQRGCRPRTEFMLAARQQGPSPHAGARQAWQRRGKCPTPRPDRITSFGVVLAGHPSSHALPSGGGARTDLRRASRGNSGGRRALSRAQLGRPRHTRLVRGASQPHLQRGPHGGLVYTTRGSSLAPRRETESTCEHTRAGRACKGHGERTGRRVRCFSTHAPLG